MQVTLLYNPHAGARAGRSDRSALQRSLEAAGHEVEAYLEMPPPQAPLELPPTRVLAVAGGNGTVLRAALAAAANRVPIAILPLGTANNLAAALGMTAPLETLVQQWDQSVLRRVDLAVAETPWGDVTFLEGAGVGALAEVILVDASGPRRDTRQVRLRRARERLDARLAAAAPLELRVELDGEVLQGSYLMAEALNISRVGPAVELAPAADPGDGLLDVVLLPAVAREGSGGFRLAAIDPSLWVTRRVQQATFTFGRAAAHVDGAARRVTGERLRMRVADQHVHVLVPAPADGSSTT